MKMKRKGTKRHRSSSSSSTSASSSSTSSDSDSSSSSSNSSSSSSSSSSSISSKSSTDNEVRVKTVKRSKRTVKKVKKKKRKTTATHKALKNVIHQPKPDANVENESSDIPISLMDKPKSLAPMTKEEWEKQQSKVKKEFDESTGRHRLIKGDGEVIEEIVSQDMHKAINKQATQGDGKYFQSKVTADLLKK